MRHRILGAVALTLMTGSVAFAEDPPPGVPQGWVRLEQVGKIRLWAPDKTVFGTASRAEFVARLREIYAAFGSIYALDRTELRAGPEGSKFPARERREVEMLLFRDDAAWDQWLLEDGKSQDSLHEGKPLSVVGFPLVDGGVPKDRWPGMWQLLSLVFIHHHFYFEPPLWLNEGLALYFAYAEKKQKPGDIPAFRERLERLRAAAEDGTAPRISDLFRRRTEPMSRAETDAAWLLVHMLIVQAKNVFTDMTKTMAGLEAAAWDGEDQAIGDLHRASEFVLTSAFGGHDGLQEACSFHLKALLKSPSMPAKLPDPPGKIVSRANFVDFDYTAVNYTWTDPSGLVRKEARVSGWARPCFPWPGKITVNGAIGDRKDRWSDDWAVTEGPSDARGTPVTWKEVALPLGDSGRQSRVAVWWAPQGGALYKFTRTVELGKAK